MSLESELRNIHSGLAMEAGEAVELKAESLTPAHEMPDDGSLATSVDGLRIIVDMAVEQVIKGAEPLEPAEVAEKVANRVMDIIAEYISLGKARSKFPEGLKTTEEPDTSSEQ